MEEIIKVIWVVIFFIFSFIIIFVWGKLYVILRKLDMVFGLVRKCGGLDSGSSPDADSTTPPQPQEPVKT